MLDSEVMGSVVTVIGQQINAISRYELVLNNSANFKSYRNGVIAVIHFTELRNVETI
jgi:hypothetical protein